MSRACRAPFLAVLNRVLCLALTLAGMLATGTVLAPEAAAQGTPSYARLTAGGHAGRGGVVVDESVLARLGPARRAPALMSQPTHRPRVSGLTLAPRLAPPPRWAMRNAPVRRGAVMVAQGDTDLAERPRQTRRRVASNSRARQLAAARAQARRIPVSLQRPAGDTRAILAAAGDAGLSPARVRQRGRTIIIEPAVIAAVMRGPAPAAAVAPAPPAAEIRAPMAPASMIAPALVASAARAPAAMAPAQAAAPTRSVAVPVTSPTAPAATARPVAQAAPASERLVPPPPALAAAPPPPPVIPAAPGIAPLGPTPLPGLPTTQLAQAQPPAAARVPAPAPAPRPAAPPPAALVPQPAPQIVAPPATPPQSAPAPARQAAAPAVRPLNLPTLTPPISPPSISPPAPQAMAAAPAALPGAIPPSTATPAALTQGAAPTSLVFAPEGLVLTQAMREELQRLARRMPSNEAVRVQVLAYATAPGNDAARARRTALSRATLVRSFLIEQGLRSTRIDVRALGQQGSDGPRDRVDLVVSGP